MCELLSVLCAVLFVASCLLALAVWDLYSMVRQYREAVESWKRYGEDAAFQSRQLECAYEGLKERFVELKLLHEAASHVITPVDRAEYSIEPPYPPGAEDPDPDDDWDEDDYEDLDDTDPYDDGEDDWDDEDDDDWGDDDEDDADEEEETEDDRPAIVIPDDAAPSAASTGPSGCVPALVSDEQGEEAA